MEKIKRRKKNNLKKEAGKNEKLIFDSKFIYVIMFIYVMLKRLLDSSEIASYLHLITYHVH